MKEENLKKNTVYQFYFNGKLNEIYIGRVVENGKHKLLEFIKASKSFSNKDYCSRYTNQINDGMKVCKLATSKQITWLDACIRADKFIPLNEVKSQIDNYEMY